MAIIRRVRSWGREQRGSNVAQAAAVALVAAMLIAVMISIGSQSLRPAATRAFNCLVAAISGSGAGCSGGPAAAQGPGDSDSGGGEDDGGGLGGWFSAGIDFIPVVGEVKGLIEVFTGTDLVTGEDLGAWRWAGLAGLIGLNEIKHLRHADEVVDAVGDIGRRGDELNDGRRALDPCPIGAAPGKGRGLAAPLAAACIVPIEKFRDYIFKPGATHGKDHVFRSLGYGPEHSEQLARMYQQQALEKFQRGEYTLGKADQYGQRIDIEIAVPGIGDNAGKTSYLRSGWMITLDGGIRLNTPFSGFTR